MGDAHPHSSYNKYKLGALVGNWVEEGALKTATGTHRYNVLSPPTPNLNETRITISFPILFFRT